MPNYYTDRVGRYQGRGDDLALAIVGEHAPKDSPFFYMPANPFAALKYWRHFNLSWGPYVAAMHTETAVGAGSNIAAAAAGLLFTNDAADNDLMQMQTKMGFTVTALKRAMMYCKVQVSDATQSDFYAGYAVADTSIVAGIPTDHALFKKDDGDTIVNGSTKDNSTASETANLITDFTAATDYEFGVVIDGITQVHFHYKLASAAAWTKVTKSTNLPRAGQVLLPTLLIQNGEAVAKTMTVKELAYAWEK